MGPGTGTVAAANLAGVWLGLARTGDSFVRVRVDIQREAGAGPAAEGRYVGTVQADPWSPTGTLPPMLAQASPVLPVSLRYQAAFGSFRLEPTPVLRQTGQPSPMLPLAQSVARIDGVYDGRGDVLVGGLAGPASRPGDVATVRHVLLVREAAFPALTAPFVLERSLVPSPGAPRPAQLVAWAAPYLASGRLERTRDRHRLTAQPHAALPLFRDEHFQRTFGVPFDALTRRRLEALEAAVGATNFLPGGTVEQAVGIGMALRPHFSVMLAQGGARQTLFHVKVQRHLLRWREQQLARLPRASLGEDPLQQIDQLAAGLRLLEGGMLWDEEMQTDARQLAARRAEVAVALLRERFKTWEDATPTPLALRELNGWRQQDARLFALAPPEQAHALLAGSRALLQRMAVTLVAPYAARLEALGQGVAALQAGTDWHRSFQLHLGPVLGQAEVQAVHQRFLALRAQHLHQAEPAFDQRLEALAGQLPRTLKPETDAQRMSLLRTLDELDAAWFNVDGDRTHPVAQRTQQRIIDLARQVAPLLPPRQRAQHGRWSSARLPDGDAERLAKARQRVAEDLLERGSLALHDDLARSQLQRPLVDPGVALQSNLVWAVFHGRFDELDPAHYRGQGVLSDRASRLGEHPQLSYVLVTYVGLSSTRHQGRQIGEPIRLHWRTVVRDTGAVVRDGWGEVILSEVLTPFYPDAYRIARGAAAGDGLLGSNGPGILQSLLEFGSGDLSRHVTRQPDGEVRFGVAAWEAPIQQDLGGFIGTWPAQSYALWQFQENLIRYLLGRPSLQSLHGHAL